MSWIMENLQILSTLESALVVYTMIRVVAKKDIREIKEDIGEMKKDISNIKQNINSIEQRLSRLEGAFEERGRWESRKNG